MRHCRIAISQFVQLCSQHFARSKMGAICKVNIPETLAGPAGSILQRRATVMRCCPSPISRGFSRDWRSYGSWAISRRGQNRAMISLPGWLSPCPLATIQHRFDAALRDAAPLRGDQPGLIVQPRVAAVSRYLHESRTRFYLGHN